MASGTVDEFKLGKAIGRATERKRFLAFLKRLRAMKKAANGES